MITERTIAAVRSAGRHPAYVLLFTAGVLAQVFSGNGRLIGFPISPDRLLFAGGLLLLVIDPDALREARMRWRTIHTLLVAMIVVVVLSGLAAGTITSSLGLYAMLDRLLVPFVAFSLAPVVYATEERRTLLLRALTCLGFYLGVTAIFEIIGPHALVFPHYIADPAVGAQYGRARGPFVQAEADGLAMIVCGFAAGVLAARSTAWWRRFGAAAATACVIGAFLTQTRSIWSGSVLSVLLVGLAVPRLRRLIPVALAVTALAIVVALAGIPSLRASVDGRAGDQRSLYDRENTDAAAVRVVETHPLTGLGWLQFELEGIEYVRQGANYPITTVDIEVHNVFLGRAAELGIPGGALFVAVILGGPVQSLRRRRRGLTGPLPDEEPDAYGWWLVAIGTTTSWLVVSMTSPLPYPQANLLLWLVGGVVAIPRLTAGAEREPAASVGVLAVAGR